jgi:hypothetical protein
LETTISTNTNISGPYNTLIYYWGDVQPVTLMASNLDRFCRGIAVDVLPRTLADAIFVTRKMGVPYLWIDALCIIQDSKTDWERESGLMAEVYGHSHCNLAAPSLFPIKHVGGAPQARSTS